MLLAPLKLCRPPYYEANFWGLNFILMLRLSNSDHPGFCILLLVLFLFVVVLSVAQHYKVGGVSKRLSMSSTTRRSNNTSYGSPQLGPADSVTAAFTSKWNDVSGEKNTVLLRVTYLLSLVVFLQGYLTASSHFMVNHMDTAFRLNQGSSEIEYSITKNKYQQHNISSSVLSTSIITNFHYVYASDTYPQRAGSSSASISSHSHSPSQSQHWRPSEYQSEQHLFRTQGFSTFSRGWIVLMLLGQVIGSSFAWKFTDSLGRYGTAGTTVAKYPKLNY